MQSGAMMMIDTSSNKESSASIAIHPSSDLKFESSNVSNDTHRYRPQDILFEESIHTLTDSEYTSGDRF